MLEDEASTLGGDRYLKVASDQACLRSDIIRDQHFTFTISQPVYRPALLHQSRTVCIYIVYIDQSPTPPSWPSL